MEYTWVMNHKISVLKYVKVVVLIKIPVSLLG